MNYCLQHRAEHCCHCHQQHGPQDTFWYSESQRNLGAMDGDEPNTCFVIVEGVEIAQVEYTEITGCDTLRCNWPDAVCLGHARIATIGRKPSLERLFGRSWGL